MASGLEELRNFDPVNTEQDACNGRRCVRCGKCCDWFYTGDLPTLTWLQNWKKWSKRDWERYRDNNFSQRFRKRINAACRYNLCIIDGDDIEVGLHFHAIGANAYYHAHQDLCLCDNNIRS